MAANSAVDGRNVYSVRIPLGVPYHGVDGPVYIEIVPDIYIERFQVAHFGGRM